MIHKYIRYTCFSYMDSKGKQKKREYSDKFHFLGFFFSSFHDGNKFKNDEIFFAGKHQEGGGVSEEIGGSVLMPV